MIPSADSYIVVTPIRDEMLNLRELIQSIVRQTVRPKLWLVVDDGSADGSYELLRQTAAEHPWIEIVQRPRKKKREIGFHYSEVTKHGLESALAICRQKNIPCDYIALLDADMRVGEGYFEALMRKFKENRRLGIASGIIFSLRDGKRILEKEPPEWPLGAARLWSRRCFEATGWMITRAPDSVSTVKAMIRGYETRNFPDLTTLQSRMTGSASGFWRGYVELGKTRYYLGYSPFFVLFAAFKYLTVYPYFGSMPFIFGYFADFIAYRKRIGDKPVIDFFKKRLLAKLGLKTKRALLSESGGRS